MKPIKKYNWSVKDYLSVYSNIFWFSDLAQPKGVFPGVLCDFPNGCQAVPATSHVCRHQTHQGKGYT